MIIEAKPAGTAPAAKIAKLAVNSITFPYFLSTKVLAQLVDFILTRCYKSAS